MAAKQTLEEREMRHPSTKIGICAALLLVMANAPIRADDLNLPVPDFSTKLPRNGKPAEPGAGKERYNKPIYNPETKSYFENYNPAPDLVYDPDYIYDWLQSKVIAEGRTFHGVRGRLAVVKNKETNDFIVKHFKPDNGTWIGLEYMCDDRILRWSTGEIWPLSGYQNWGRPWNIEGTSPYGRVRSSCTSLNPMGVHYWGSEAGYKWNANGGAKKFGYMIIEYPTGKP